MVSEARALFNANDGLTGRDGGPYLDLEEAKAAEIRRAEVEGREPDFEANMGSSAGIKLVRADQLLLVENVTNIPSQENNSALNIEEAVRAIADDDANPLRVAFEVPEEAFAEEEENDLSTAEALSHDQEHNNGEGGEVSDQQQTQNEGEEPQKSDVVFPSDPNNPAQGETSEPGEAQPPTGTGEESSPPQEKTGTADTYADDVLSGEPHGEQTP